MAIGQNVLTIDQTEFSRGISSSSEALDGGFSPETKKINPTKKLGAIYGSSSVTDKSTNLEDEIIASCEDPNYTGKNKLFLDDSGNFYSWNGTTLTKEVTASGDLFTIGTTDFVPFYTTADGVMFYATTKAGANGDIVRWNKTSTLVENWWSNASYLNQGALSALTPHRPLIVYERNLFVGDANKLHRIDESKTVSNGILTLQTGEIITALGIDPGSGKMLIATTSSSSYSGTRNNTNKILIYDGFSNKAQRVINVSGLITSFKAVDGVVYIFYGNKMGYWNGSGITFLRDLNISLSGDQLIYPHKVTSDDNTLYIAENTDVLAYGPIGRGNRAFYYIDQRSANITNLTNLGNKLLGISYATAAFDTFDLTGGAGTTDFYSLKYVFPREVNIREIVFHFADNISASANGVTNMVVYGDEAGGLGTSLGTLTNNKAAVVTKLVKTTSKIKTSQMQLFFRFVANIGVKRIDIKYDTSR